MWLLIRRTRSARPSGRWSHPGKWCSKIGITTYLCGWHMRSRLRRIRSGPVPEASLRELSEPAPLPRLERVFIHGRTASELSRQAAPMTEAIAAVFERRGIHTSTGSLESLNPPPELAKLADQINILV